MEPIQLKQLLPNVPNPAHLELGGVQCVAVFSMDGSFQRYDFFEH